MLPMGAKDKLAQIGGIFFCSEFLMENNCAN
jgi:hypothetical protein